MLKRKKQKKAINQQRQGGEKVTLGQHIISDLRRNLGIERPQNKTMHAYDMQDEGLLEWLGISKKRKGVTEVTPFLTDYGNFRRFCF